LRGIGAIVHVRRREHDTLLAPWHPASVPCLPWIVDLQPCPYLSFFCVA
jgi:hypothetical protein